MDKSISRVIVTKQELVCLDGPFAVNAVYQVWLYIDGRFLEVGAHQKSESDVDAVIALLKRVIPGVSVKKCWKE